MAIGVGSLIEVSLTCALQGQQAMNVWQYRVEVFPATISAGDIADGWWQHVKTTYRAVATSEFASLFKTVSVRELDSATGEYGEYAIPAGETAGTRVSSGGAELMPPFVSAAVKLVVGTRLTRPGQKRLFGFVEGDNVSGYVNTGAVTAINNHMNIMAAGMVLGAPAALTGLQPAIVSKDAAGLPTNYQYVTGYLVNPAFSSQVSRKFGRGA